MLLESGGFYSHAGESGQFLLSCCWNQVDFTLMLVVSAIMLVESGSFNFCEHRSSWFLLSWRWEWAVFTLMLATVSGFYSPAGESGWFLHSCCWNQVVFLSCWWNRVVFALMIVESARFSTRSAVGFYAHGGGSVPFFTLVLVQLTFSIPVSTTSLKGYNKQ